MKIHWYCHPGVHPGEVAVHVDVSGRDISMRYRSMSLATAERVAYTVAELSRFLNKHPALLRARFGELH